MRDFHWLLALIHQCINDAGYNDVILDMSNCTAAFQNSMLSVCAQVAAFRNGGIDFSLIPPKNQKLLNLFKNTNWGHYLAPRQFDPANFRGHSKVPAIQYRTPDEQNEAVNKIVNVMLGALPELNRSDLAAFEWTINELTDNVLVHSESSIGGLVQVSTFVRNSKRIQFVVADAGEGIPKTLRSGNPDIGSDTNALDQAIREGVTRDKNLGQGNGLYGSYRVCSESRGSLLVDSGHARLIYDKGELSVVNQKIPYSGTLVVATLDFSNSDLLAQALKFNGEVYEPVDYVETNYEKTEGTIAIKLIDECKSFGSRVSGKPVRQKIHNLINMSPSSRIVVDFSGIPVLSSSFADEAIGKLFLQLGPLNFMSSVKLAGMMGTVEAIINKAIAQRMQVGTSDAGE